MRPAAWILFSKAVAHCTPGGCLSRLIPAGYNQRLSERRANAVAAALERLGVPRSDMVVAGHSFNDLRVPTPPGVREPQNRRVEIVFP